MRNAAKNFGGFVLKWPVNKQELLMSDVPVALTSNAPQLQLVPYPRYVLFRGSPFRPTPSNYLYIATEATYATRRRCTLLCQQLLDLGFKTNIETSSKLNTNQALFTASASFPKWDNLNRPLRPEASGFQAYRLVANSDGVLLNGADEQGLQYACATLRQLVEDNPTIPGVEIEDFPMLRWRAIHLDCKGWPPNVDYLKRVISTLAGIKINALLLEYGPAFNFPSQPGLAIEGALTPADLTTLQQYAEDVNVALFPLVHCIGNAGHVLSQKAYSSMREHPGYFQQYCPANESAVDVVTAMIDDLLSIHHDKKIHLGGDDAVFMGANPATAARAKKMGGRTAVYLEYLGRMCNYLISKGNQPLICDDMFRAMTDEQIKWLPKETILVSSQNDGSSGRASSGLLKLLNRYKQLGRSIWGSPLCSPTYRHESFDHIDAWAEAAQAGLIDGMCATVRTREYWLGPLLPPLETVWPSVFYAAEKSWLGQKGPSRDGFPHRFVTRFFGARDDGAKKLWLAYDLYRRDHFVSAREQLMAEEKQAVRNRKTLAFFDCWLALESFKEYARQFEIEVGSNFSLIQTGRADPFNAGRLRWRIQDAKAKLPAIAARFQQQGLRLTHQNVVQEYMESSIAFSLKQLDDMEVILSGYPLPPADWQKPVRL